MGFYKDPCPRCGRLVARGKGVREGTKWYHDGCLLCAHGVRMSLDTCLRCNPDSGLVVLRQ